MENKELQINKSPYAVEMINITKKFGNIYANKNVNLKIKKGEIHALLGENGAGKSTIMSILFGMYEPDEGSIKVNGETVKIKDPNVANKLKIGMVHQHFKLVDCYTLLENIVLGKETSKNHFVNDVKEKEDAILHRLSIISGFDYVEKNYKLFSEIFSSSKTEVDFRYNLINKMHLTPMQTDAILSLNFEEFLSNERYDALKKEAVVLRQKFIQNAKDKEKRINKIKNKLKLGIAKALDWLNEFTHNVDLDKAALDITQISRKYGLNVNLNAKVEDSSVGAQQRTEILKMLYRENDILIFDEPTAVLTPQEIEALLNIMKNLKREGKTIIFITHKLNEIMTVADRVTILRKGEVINTVNTKDTDVQKLSDLMVGRHVSIMRNTSKKKPGATILKIRNLTMYDKAKQKNSITDVSFDIHKGEIVTIAGIDGNGQRELVSAITGLEKTTSGQIIYDDFALKDGDVKFRNFLGMSHIPEDRHKHGLVLEYDLKQNLILRDFKDYKFSKYGFIREKNVEAYAKKMIKEHDIRSSSGAVSSARSMSGGNQQKLIIARELDRKPNLLVAVQPTRGVDIGAIENINAKLLKQRDRGVGILLVSFELEEVFGLSDRILVMHDGEIVGEFKPKEIDRQTLGLYMSGAKKDYTFVEEGK